MIRLKKDGKYFDIEPGEKLTIEWVFTTFNDEAEFNGSYTYTVKAPFSPTNNALLNHANQIENRSARFGTTAVIEIFGQDWKQAKLTYSVSPKGYELYCLIDNAEFAKVIKEKTLPEVFVNYSNGEFGDFIYDRLSNSRAETIALMMDRANHPGKGSCVFFSQKNENIFGSYDGDGEDNSPAYLPDYVINHYNDSAAFMRDAFSDSNRKRFFYNPSYYLLWVVRKVCSYLGFEATGEMLADPRLQNTVIDNTGFIDVPEIFALDGCKLAVARHLPNIKLADFFKMLRSTYKVVPYFDGNERKAYFNYAPNILTNTDAVDITGYTEDGLTIETYVPTGYEIEQAIDGDDDLFKTFEYVKSYFIGNKDETQKLSSFAGTCFMTDVKEERPLYTSKWRIPRKQMVGNGYTSAAAGTESYNDTGWAKNDFSFRVLNYWGIRYDSQVNPYYYASSDTLNPDGSDNADALSCWLGGERGLINTYMKQWLMYYLRTESVEITAYLPGSVLLKLSPLKKLLFTTGTRALVPALINQVSFEQSSRYTGRLSAKIKLYPIYNQAATDIKAFKSVERGEIENPGKIYVKYVQVEYSRDEIKLFGNIKILGAIYCHGYLEFYSDQECTKPRSVTNLLINMIFHYRGANVRNYDDRPFQVRASGSRHQIMEALGVDQTYQNTNNSKDYWTKSYELNAAGGADYIPVK